MAQRHATKFRQQSVLAFIKAHQPTRLDILNKFYKTDLAGARKFQRDLEILKDEYDISQNENDRYILNQSNTANIIEASLTPEEKMLFQHIAQEFPSGHPFAAQFQQLFSKLTGRLNEQQELLQQVPPASYFGPRFARDYTHYRPLIEELEAAIRQRRCISFVYNRPVSRNAENVQHSVVEPHSIGVRYGTFYLYGYNRKTQHGLDYRIDKIENLKVLGEKFGAFKKPEDIVFEYELRPEVVKGGISERFNNQQVIATFEDGSVRVRATERKFWIKQEALRNSKMIVVSPDWLRQEIAAEIETMRQNYQNLNIELD